VLGRDRRETNALRKKFLELNKTFPYPKRPENNPLQDSTAVV
jgi:hypothetical protein